jgi:Fe-S-cluster containining protein
MINLCFKTTKLADVISCLDSYRRLVARVDRTLDRVRSRYPDDIACTKGCDCGCRNISIFPLEAIAVVMAVWRLPAETAAAVRRRAATHSMWDCPLHAAKTCQIYPFRPMICRTHGFPLSTVFNGRPSIGCCRRNFKNGPPIPHDAVIDLDRINSSLRAINAAITGRLSLQVPARLPISAAVLIEFR